MQKTKEPDDKLVLYTSDDPSPSLRERLTRPDDLHLRIARLGAVYLFGIFAFFFLPGILGGRYQAPANLWDFYRFFFTGLFDPSVYTRFLSKPSTELYGPAIASILPWILAFPILALVLFFGLGSSGRLPQMLLLVFVVTYKVKAFVLYYVATLPHQNVGPFGYLWALLSDALIYIVSLPIMLSLGLLRNYLLQRRLK